MQPLNSTPPSIQPRVPSSFLTNLAKIAETQNPVPGDSVQLSQGPQGPVKLPNLKPTPASPEPGNIGYAAKKLARAGLHAAVGAATMGVATAFCSLGMLLSHKGTEGDNGLLLGAGVTIGTLAGLAAGVFTGSPLIGLATFGGISQGMIGLTDWASKG